MKLKTTNYNSFAQKCVAGLQKRQEKFQEKYVLDWYENWFYNHATGLLTFSTGEVELNFKYFVAGTFSKRSNTWKWAWDNAHMPHNVKKQTQLIKEFGERENYPKLINGLFESNELEAGEFAAIAAKLTNGLTTYRPVDHNEVKMYLVITEFVDNETAKNIKDKYVECGSHEYRRRAFVCHHLNYTTKVGFEEAFETEEDMELLGDDDLQAWCHECEAVRQKEGEWNERSTGFANIKLVCEKCYFEMKELNLGHR